MPDVILDILHSYLGLAALASMRDPELRSIDPMLCISVRARETFESMVNVEGSYIQISGG